MSHWKKNKITVVWLETDCVTSACFGSAIRPTFFAQSVHTAAFSVPHDRHDCCLSPFHLSPFIFGSWTVDKSEMAFEAERLCGHLNSQIQDFWNSREDGRGMRRGQEMIKRNSGDTGSEGMP